MRPTVRNILLSALTLCLLAESVLSSEPCFLPRFFRPTASVPQTAPVVVQSNYQILPRTIVPTSYIVSRPVEIYEEPSIPVRIDDIPLRQTLQSYDAPMYVTTIETETIVVDPPFRHEPVVTVGNDQSTQISRTPISTREISAVSSQTERPQLNPLVTASEPFEEKIEEKKDEQAKDHGIQKMIRKLNDRIERTQKTVVETSQIEPKPVPEKSVSSSEKAEPISMESVLSSTEFLPNRDELLGKDGTSKSDAYALKEEPKKKAEPPIKNVTSNRQPSFMDDPMDFSSKVSLPEEPEKPKKTLPPPLPTTMLGQVNTGHSGELDEIMSQRPPLPEGPVDPGILSEKLVIDPASSTGPSSLILEKEPPGDLSPKDEKAEKEVKNAAGIGGAGVNGTLWIVTIASMMMTIYVMIIAYDYYQRWIQSLTAQNRRFANPWDEDAFVPDYGEDDYFATVPGLDSPLSGRYDPESYDGPRYD